METWVNELYKLYQDIIAKDLNLEAWIRVMTREEILLNKMTDLFHSWRPCNLAYMNTCTSWHRPYIVRHFDTVHRRSRQYLHTRNDDVCDKKRTTFLNCVLVLLLFSRTFLFISFLIYYIMAYILCICLHVCTCIINNNNNKAIQVTDFILRHEDYFWGK